MTRGREVLWLVAVIAIVALAFFFGRSTTGPAAPSARPSADQSTTTLPSPAVSPPRSTAPLERTQFSWEVTPPYGSSVPWFRLQVRGTPTGATYAARMTREGSTVEDRGVLTRDRYRAFMTLLEDRGVWLLRDDSHSSHRDTVHYQAYIQSGDWTRRATFCTKGDPHAEAIVQAVQENSFISEVEKKLQANLSPGP